MKKLGEGEPLFAKGGDLRENGLSTGRKKKVVHDRRE